MRNLLPTTKKPRIQRGFFVQQTANRVIFDEI
jgi:hypothetical protein